MDGSLWGSTLKFYIMSFISAFQPCPQQTIRELFDVNEGEKKEAVAEVVVAPSLEDDESSHKQSTTILEQVSSIPRYSCTCFRV